MIDVPQTRAEAVALLRARGIEAHVRDWAMGKTIVVVAGKSSANGIDVWERSVWIVEGEEPREWTVVALDGFEHVLARFTSLGLACERAIVAVGPSGRTERLDALLEVEGVLEARGRHYVITRLIHSARDFMVVESSRLHGCPVEQWLEMPRAHDASGHPRFDQFAFCLRNAPDRRHLRVGARVALTSRGDGDFGD